MNKLAKLGIIFGFAAISMVALPMKVMADSGPNYAFITSIKKPIYQGNSLRITGGCGGAGYSRRVTITARNLSRANATAYKTFYHDFGLVYTINTSITAKMQPIKAKTGDKISITLSCDFYIAGGSYSTTRTTTASFRVKAKPVVEQPNENPEQPEPQNSNPTPAIIHDLNVSRDYSSSNLFLFLSIVALVSAASYLGWRYVAIPIYQKYK